jgi:hypothetical protein
LLVNAWHEVRIPSGMTIWHNVRPCPAMFQRVRLRGRVVSQKPCGRNTGSNPVRVALPFS